MKVNRTGADIFVVYVATKLGNSPRWEHTSVFKDVPTESAVEAAITAEDEELGRIFGRYGSVPNAPPAIGLTSMLRYPINQSECLEVSVKRTRAIKVG